MHSPGRFLASARLIALLTLASRLLGLGREAVFGYLLGASPLLSAFRIAFMLPNLARRLFGEGALSSALIPALSKDLHEGDLDSSRRLVGNVLTLLVVILSAGVIATEAVILVWYSFRPHLILGVAAVLMPYMVLICTTAVLGGVLNVRNHFAVPAAVPIILNLGIIGAALGGHAWFAFTGEQLINAIAVGVLLAGVAQLLLMLAALKRLRFFPIVGRSWRDPRIKAIFAAMGPMILGLSAVQINSLADYLIAYFAIVTEEGRVGPAVLGFAQFLYQLPLGVFGIALATAIFPVLSARAAEDDHTGVWEALNRGIRASLVVALPATVGLIFVARPLVVTLFERGAFDASDTGRVVGTLVCYSLGLPAYFLHHLLVRTFYALHENKTPARIAARMVLINFAMNLALVFWLQERGLALATATCAMIQTIWLGMRLQRVLPGVSWRLILPGVSRIALATLVMAVCLIALLYAVRVYPSLDGYAPVKLAILVAGGVITYGLTAHLLRIGELKMLLRRGSAFQEHKDA
jgi:putative peptidoglycan lipid II flippase